MGWLDEILKEKAAPTRGVKAPVNDSLIPGSGYDTTGYRNFADTSTPAMSLGNMTGDPRYSIAPTPRAATVVPPPAQPTTPTAGTRPASKIPWMGDLGAAEMAKGNLAPHEYVPPKPAAPSGVGGSNDGSSVKNFLIDGLKGLGSMIAEGGYAAAYRSGGNQGDYAPSWDRAVRTNNPGSAYSENIRNLLANNPRYAAQIKSMPQFGQMGGDDVTSLYGDVLNREGYMDTMDKQSKSKYDAIIEREKMKRSGRIAGGGGGQKSGLTKLSSKQEDALVDAQATIDSMDRLMGTHESVFGKGGMTVVDSGLMNLAQGTDSLLGTSMADPAKKEFMSKHGTFAANYLKTISGLATTDKEYIRLMNNLPKPWSPTFQREMQAWRTDADSVKASKVDTYKKLGKDLKGYGEESTSAQPAPSSDTNSNPLGLTIR